MCEGHVKTNGTATSVQSKDLLEIIDCAAASEREGRQDLATPVNFFCVNRVLGYKELSQNASFCSLLDFIKVRSFLGIL